MEEIGQFIIMSPEDGDFEQGIKSTICKIVVANGLPLNEITKPIINKLAKERAENVIRHTKRGGISTSLKILLNLKEKRRVISWIKNIVITKSCLSNLILNCKKLGFSHKQKHKEFIPDGIIPPLEERRAIIGEGKADEINDEKVEKILRRLSTAYNERKYLSAHLFEKGDEWHLFYFDYNDLYIPTGLNHHSRGPHIHYVSFLWGSNFNKEKLWQQFENRNIKINGEHIRFIENDNSVKKKARGKQIEKSRCRLESVKPQHLLKIGSQMLCYREEASVRLTPKDIHITP